MLRALTHRVLVRAFTLHARVTARLLARRWRQNAPDEIQAHRDEIAGFEQRLYRRWADGLDALELLRLRALAVGSAFNDQARPGAAAEQDYLFDVLAKLHARGCRVTSEVLALLRSGHAEGAHARWRTLHEIAVTMMFLHEHGRAVAEMYLLHGAAREHAVAEQYQRHAEDLGEPRFNVEDMDEMRAVRDQLVARFGPRYAKEYGWANVALNLKNARFVDIERAVTMEKWRPWYRMASEGQHAGSQALRFALPLLSPRLLGGPSNAGLAAPGVATAISLMQATSTFVISWPESASVRVRANAMRDAFAVMRLVHDVQRGFHLAEAQLEREHAEEEEDEYD